MNGLDGSQGGLAPLARAEQNAAFRLGLEDGGLHWVGVKIEDRCSEFEYVERTEIWSGPGNQPAG